MLARPRALWQQAGVSNSRRARHRHHAALAACFPFLPGGRSCGHPGELSCRPPPPRTCCLRRERACCARRAEHSTASTKPSAPAAVHAANRSPISRDSVQHRYSLTERYSGSMLLRSTWDSRYHTAGGTGVQGAGARGLGAAGARGGVRQRHGTVGCWAWWAGARSAGTRVARTRSCMPAGRAAGGLPTGSTRCALTCAGDVGDEQESAGHGIKGHARSRRQRPDLRAGCARRRGA